MAGSSPARTTEARRARAAHIAEPTVKARVLSGSVSLRRSERDLLYALAPMVRAATRLRRHPAQPRPVKPSSIMAHVEGSGVAGALPIPRLTRIAYAPGSALLRSMEK